VAAAALLFSVHLFAQQPAGAVVDPAVKIRQEAFDKVWNTVNDKHYDPTFGGVDWQKMRKIYEPKAMAAGSNSEFHAVLRQMLGELKLSHFAVFGGEPGKAVADTGGGTIGIELSMLEGVPVVSRVEADSAAGKAGIKTGFIIHKIDGKTASDILKPLEALFAARGFTEGMQRIYRERMLQTLIDGKPQTPVKIEMLDGKDQPRTFIVVRELAVKEMSQPIGNFPPQEVIFESKRLASGIGYIRFNMWIIPQMARIRQAVKELGDAKGLIVDLRGNPGGLGAMAPGFAGLLMNERSSLGSMNSRETVQQFIIYPQSGAFLGEVVILSDHGSASTSEVFAAGLQEIQRAKIVGETSAGAVLPSIFDTLPTGAIFQYAVSDYRSPKKMLIEGRGVIPDVKVKPSRQALLEGRDLQLEAAEKLILNQE
jgi:carboxyl-terminal processing protease